MDPEGDILSKLHLARFKNLGMELFQRFWRKIICQLFNKSMDNTVHKTAPATPGLLKTWRLKDPLPPVPKGEVKK